MQNATTLAEIQSLLQDICIVFSQRDAMPILDHLKTLQTKIHNQSVFADVDFNETPLEEVVTEKTPKTIVHDSPFARLFEKTLLDTQNEQGSGTAQANPYYCPSLIQILKPYLATVPLWTGIMLKHLGKTRDTNTQVENWFRTTKPIVLKNKLHRRPGDFVQIMYEFMCGRMRGVTVSAIREDTVNEKETNDSKI